MKFFCAQAGIEFKKNLISLRKEFFRKTIHMCSVFVPLALHFFRVPVIVCLCFAGLAYSAAEFSRIRGREIPFISDITAAAARKRDENRFVLGPVTLVAGIVLCAILWPEKPCAVGILALAFGDGSASLAGKTFGMVKIPFTHGKTAAGSLTCFFAIFTSTFLVTKDTKVSLLTACTGAIVEVMPLKDFDNVLIPVLLGGISMLLLNQ